MTGTRTRRRVIVDQTELARQIGTRLRAARLAAGLTQQQLATPRYTKAYVSALENGLSRPSMAALTFFSGRLGLPAERFLGDGPAAWARLEADLALAAHRWEEAADAYTALLADAGVAVQRAELLLGLAEAQVGLERGAEAATAAEEAAQLFATLGRQGQTARARYWLALAQCQQGDVAEGSVILRALLEEARGGLRVAPDFELRVLMALSGIAARSGDHATALGYLGDIQDLAARLDARRRAAFYQDIAMGCRDAGDFESAMRAGTASLALYRAGESELELAALENDLAVACLALGDAGRAAELATDAHARYARLGEEKPLARVLGTEARIALARDAREDGLRLAREALDLAERTANRHAEIDALVTLARAESAEGRRDEAIALYERAADAARAIGSPPRLREVLGEWAELLAQSGEHERAFELMREALKGRQ